MAEPRVMKEFFAKNLPTNIRDVINLDSIQSQKESFINDSLKLQIADILYSAEFGDQLGYLYILIEHQSTPSELMPFRILQYMVAIMNHHLTKTGKNRLPIVYPMIFYNGWKPYNYSTNIFDLFGDKKELARGLFYRK
jgi:predicted transposase/invertase (TIGR01784 family)